MAAAELTVRRLRLAPQGAAARTNEPTSMSGVAARIEDALRVSSKPAALLHRHVLVRRLRLRAAPGASAQSLALLFERAWLHLAGEAQPIETACDAAEVVWASSATAARAALLARWLRGEPTDAWFWQRVAPSARALEWPQRALALMRAPLDEAAAGGAVAGAQPAVDAALVRALLAVIARHGAQRRFVAAIDETDAAALLSVLGGASPAQQEMPARADGVPTARAVAPAASARARLLARMNARSASLRASSGGERIARRIARAAADPDAMAGDAPAARGVAAPAARKAAAAGSRPPRAATVIDEKYLATPSLANGSESAWAGLWLMLPILLRHGLADADEPLAAWTAALRAACLRFRVADDDPVHAAIASLEPPAATAADRWLRVARLAAVREAHLPLQRVARRRGAAWLSPERIDVEFAASGVDVRIRRAGFDIDPGFVPWLGRCVHFHYA